MLDSINKIIDSNQMIMKEFDKSNAEIANIVSPIKEIGEKTKIINDIVFQTKLLSFNASVEAARAGENGKGFAVVAEEVGNLAAMSGNAAIEISQKLNNSIQEVETIVHKSKLQIEKQIHAGKNNVEKGVRVAKECEGVLDEIVKSVAHVTQSVAQISNASQEQAQGVQEVTKAIAQLDQVTQENNRTAADSAASAAHLSDQAHTLMTLVENLVLAVEGKKTA